MAAVVHLPLPETHAPTVSMERAGLCSGIGQHHTNKPGHPKRKAYISVTLSDIAEMLDSPPEVVKEKGQWVIPSTLPSRVHAEQRNQGEFCALWADIDEPDGMTFQEMFSRASSIVDADFMAYTSRSATEDKQKARLLVPLAKPVNGELYLMLQIILNDKLAEAGITPDRKTEGAGQICYLPNRGDFYRADSIDFLGAFDPSQWSAEVAAKKAEARGKQAELERQREKARLRATVRRESGELSPMDAFNAEYSIEMMLAAYGYTQYRERWLSPYSESGSPGVTVSADGSKWLSAHGSDVQAGLGKPTDSGAMGDAFDLFVHYEHEGDQSAAIRAAGEMFTTAEGVSLTKANQRTYMAAHEDQHALLAFEGLDSDESNPTKDEQANPFDLDRARIAPDWFTETPPPREWLIDEFLPSGVVGVVASRGGVGKSMLLLNLALCVATGNPFLGMETKKTGKVVYLSAEDDRDEMRRRLFNLASGLEFVDQLDFDQVSENLYLFDLVAHGVKFTRQEGGAIHIDTKSVGRLRKALAELGDVVLIVIDTYSRFNGGEENNNGHSAEFVNACELIRKDTGANLLVAAHVTKASAHGSSLSANDVAGGGRLTDAARWMAGLRRYLDIGENVSPEDMNHVELRIGKSNYGNVMGKTLWLEYVDGSIQRKAERAIPHVKVTEAENIKRNILVKIREAQELGEPLTSWKLSRMKADTLGVNGTKACEEYLPQLIREGRVKVSEDKHKRLSTDEIF